MPGFPLVAPFVLLAALATPPASPSPPEPSAFCPVSVRLTAIDPSRYALDFITPDAAQTASGFVSLYATGVRYDVRFENVAVRHRGLAFPDGSGVPFVVRFPQPVDVESAVVVSLDAPSAHPCGPLYAPWVARPAAARSGPQPTDVRAREEAFRKAAVAAPAHDVPAPVPYARVFCSDPFANPRAVDVFEPQSPAGAHGNAQVIVTIGVDGGVMRADLWKSANTRAADEAAVEAARRTRFAPERFHCTPVAGDYLFSVEFTR